MKTFAQSINTALEEKLAEDPRVLLLGEDLRDPYGGAFKITKGLSSRYPDRVLNTPMSEFSLAGVAAGLAIRGLRPVLEIMFGDFMTFCADQLINHAVKFRWMYNGQVDVPLVIRTPMGGGRGYGPTHSQSLEKIFMGIPGLKIIAASHFHDAGTLLKDAIDDDNPVLFIEHKLLYPRKIGQPVDGYISDFAVKFSDGRYKTLRLSNTDFDDPQLTVLVYGGMLPWVTEAVNELLVEEEVGAEIVVPSYINQSFIPEMMESVKTTGRLVIVEEGTLSFGWGAEMAARIVTHESIGSLKAPVRRVAAKDLPLANSRVLEEATLPQVRDIKKAVQEVLAS